ncbi:hypothetical protein DERP_006941 [Dermatophagoides pteronyssinus]|uniref:Uncharacterized protein n=1 Tax=Dermatophagoides pteronyssinus TaxID=6956 RepID=A0ABQ8JTV2_DERPT|nr:hypothetical protein DERP_006941 [Dermatophagoides pteronyssinus]
MINIKKKKINKKIKNQKNKKTKSSFTLFGKKRYYPNDSKKQQQQTDLQPFFSSTLSTTSSSSLTAKCKEKIITEKKHNHNRCSSIIDDRDYEVQTVEMNLTGSDDDDDDDNYDCIDVDEKQQKRLHTNKQQSLSPPSPVAAIVMDKQKTMAMNIRQRQRQNPNPNHFINKSMSQLYLMKNNLQQLNDRNHSSTTATTISAKNPLYMEHITTNDEMIDNNNMIYGGGDIPIFRSQSYHNLTTNIANNKRLINEIDYYPRRSCCTTFQKPLTDIDHSSSSFNIIIIFNGVFIKFYKFFLSSFNRLHVFEMNVFFMFSMKK